MQACCQTVDSVDDEPETPWFEKEDDTLSDNESTYSEGETLDDQPPDLLEVPDSEEEEDEVDSEHEEEQAEEEIEEYMEPPKNKSRVKQSAKTCQVKLYVGRIE